MEQAVEGACVVKTCTFHIPHMDTAQSLSGWLKEMARKNMAYILFTLETFQLLRGWLKRGEIFHDFRADANKKAPR